MVCVTRGRGGAAMWHAGAWSEHPGFEVDVRDTVGAGDAFLAVLLAGLLRDMDGAALLRHANLIGAYVSTQSGALPADQQATTSALATSAAPGARADRSHTGERRRPRTRPRKGPGSPS
jgi:fructokinase